MLKAFHSKKKIKLKHLDAVLYHLLPNSGKRCGLRCSIQCASEKDVYKNYEVRLGIPRWLGALEHALYIGMGKKKAASWPKRFLSSIKVGSDLNKVKTPFIIIVLNDCLKNFDHNKHPNVKKCVDDVITLYKKGGTEKQFQDARAKANTASEVANSYCITTKYTTACTYAAAYSAAWTAAYAAASYVAASADDPRYEETTRIADVIKAATNAANYTSRAEGVNDGVAKSRTYDQLADELIKLIKGL